MSSRLSDSELAAFDYDGTLATEGGSPPAPEVLLGTQALWRAGIETSIITARPYQRLESIADGVHRLVSTGTPIATERGARVVDGQRTENLSYASLDQHELAAIGDFCLQGDVEFVGFYPRQLHGRSYIWTPDAHRHPEMLTRFGHDATVLTPTSGALRQSLEEADPCLVTIRFSQPSSGRDLGPCRGLNVALTKQTVSLITAGVDKLTALQTICDASGSSLKRTAYAGNDENDLPVLACHDLLERIYVGGNDVAGIAEPATRLESPSALGRYLVQSMDGLA